MYEFKEHNLMIKGEKQDLLDLVQIIRQSQAEGVWSDLVYKIEYEFDLDGIRSLDEKSEEEEE